MIDTAEVAHLRPTSAAGESAALVEWTFEGRALASPLRLTVTASGDVVGTRRLATAAWDEVLAEFAAVDVALSRFRDDSHVTALNRSIGGERPVPVPPRLRVALAASHRAWRMTRGRFDPRVLTALDGLGYRGAAVGSVPRPPAPAGEWLWLDPRSALAAVTAPVDLGGIGKGLALRWAARRVARLLDAAVRSEPRGALARGDHPEVPVHGFLLDAGGDIVASAPSPQGGTWFVGIEDPVSTGQPAGQAAGDGEPAFAPRTASLAPPSTHAAVIAVTRGAVCTSSSTFLRWTAPSGEHVHHLIDPDTGRPGGDGLLTVTVAGPDAAWAEVWSKGLFLAGRHGIGEVARREGLAAWWIEEDGTLSMTPAARLITAWSR